MIESIDNNDASGMISSSLVVTETVRTFVTVSVLVVDWIGSYVTFVAIYEKHLEDSSLELESSIIKKHNTHYR